MNRRRLLERLAALAVLPGSLLARARRGGSEAWSADGFTRERPL